MKAIRLFGGLLLIMVLGMLIFSQCNEEPAPEANAKFTLQNVDPDDISISQSVTVVFEMNPVRSEQHLVLYSGEPKHSYDSLKNNTTHSVTGTPISGNVYEDLVYTQSGTFKLTAVATTYGNWSEEVKQDIYSITVTVTDGRTKMSSFQFDYKTVGNIVHDSVIYVDVIETAPFDSLVANFTLVSDSAQAFVGNTLQKSGVTANDFTKTVTYTVKAPDGTSRDYFVKVDTLLASKNNNLSIVFKNYPDKDYLRINDTTFFIRLPWGASSSQPVNYEIAKNASIMFNDSLVTGGTKTIDVTDINVVDVIAQNLDTARYYITADFDAFPVTSFSFKDIHPTKEAKIDHNDSTITYPVLYSDVDTSMVAYYEASRAAKVFVKEEINDSTFTFIEQTSGQTANNFADTVNSFADPVNYYFIGDNDDTVKYGVKIIVYTP